MADRKGKVKTKTDGESSEAPSRGTTPFEEDSLPEVNELQWAKDIFDAHKKQLGFTEHSNKVVMAINIVTEAISQGESVLIFFHSIPTLHYVEEKLRRRGCDVNVLEGKTPIKDRQNEVDRFNRTNKAVYLVSTRVFPLPNEADLQDWRPWPKHHIGEPCHPL